MHSDRWIPRWHGIQARFLPVLATFVIVSMAALGITLYFNQRHITLNRFEQDTQNLRQVLQDKGNAYSTFLARIAPQGILAHDYLLLEGYTEELSADADVVYAVILNRGHRPITHFLKRSDAPDGVVNRAGVKPEQFMESLAQARADTSLLIVRRDIDYNGTILGSVEVGLSREKIASTLAELKVSLEQELRRIAMLTGGEILIALVILILMSEMAFHRLVMRPIRALGTDMARVQAGNLGARTRVDREDEIGWLARGFNKMAADLQDHVHKIEEQRLAYKDMHDYLANILDNSADMIATTALDGSIVEFNAAAERILGYRRDEVVNRASSSLYCDPQERDRLYDSAQNGQVVQNAEIRLRCKNGEMIDAELTLSPLRDNAGNLIGTVCIGRDITRAKAMRRDLIQAEKMASVGQVSAWIAHQIRNSLGRILMVASAMQPGRDGTEEQQQTCRNLKSSIAGMDNIVSDLLDYSRTLSLHPTPADLNSVLDDLLASHADGGLNGHHRIERVFGPDLPLVRIDVFKMEQALGNVLKNAMQAMPGEGTLRVETRRGPGARQVTVMVQDSGPGIPPENLQKVFRPFFTTKPGGTGLGLAIASRIVEAHGGRVAVESAEGRGAAFIFILPEVPPR
ncbi:histidine kinase [Sulfuricaulis limicola]|uniref:histidine kinase n=1 Tax=Sulfuricaulis limicola TaxID=1620215 RepID=A0A1B4XGV0_9GAMM|nr:HAMP domain-containing sensor histidine kinase [Sulfuricaulis limicola]BAV34051.1 histidine kinase [Sulfuricaulis limicola]